MFDVNMSDRSDGFFARYNITELEGSRPPLIFLFSYSASLAFLV